MMNKSSGQEKPGDGTPEWTGGPGVTQAGDTSETKFGTTIAKLEAEIIHRQRVEQDLRGLAAIVEQSEDAIIGKTPEGIITSWNLGAERIYGYHPKEAVGRSIAILYPPDRLPELDMVLERIRKGERVQRLETVRRTKDGRDIHISLSVSPIRNAAGRVVAASAIARDITARRIAEQELQRINAQLEDLVRERTAQLEAANKELEAFSYSVSHDLRAPLRAIDGFSQALADEYLNQLDERGHHYIERVRTATRRMGRLIDDLLKLSRVSRGSLESIPMDLSHCALEILAELKHADSQRQIEVIVQPDLHAQADPHLLRIALENLLGNAWKFTRHTPHPRIEFGQYQAENRTWYFVHDNGAGFDMAYAGKLFGAFQRLHSPQQYEGTGIGLATVQRIIHRHGGTVRAEGIPGMGATFHFTLADAPQEDNPS